MLTQMMAHVIHKYGCLDPTAVNYNDYDGDNYANPISDIDSVNINSDNGVCFDIAIGCTDCDEDDGTPTANGWKKISYLQILKLNPLLVITVDMDPIADNYDPIYNVPSETVYIMDVQILKL